MMDYILTSWLISEEVLAMVDGTENAHQVWKSLEEQLLTLTKENELHLNEALISLRKGTLSLNDYLKKFKGLCDTLILHIINFCELWSHMNSN